MAILPGKRLRRPRSDIRSAEPVLGWSMAGAVQGRLSAHGWHAQRAGARAELVATLQHAGSSHNRFNRRPAELRCLTHSCTTLRRCSERPVWAPVSFQSQSRIRPGPATSTECATGRSCQPDTCRSADFFSRHAYRRTSGHTGSGGRPGKCVLRTLKEGIGRRSVAGVN
jgi:hypothetical protein